MTYFASDFKNVDGTNAIQTFTQCLKLQQSLESYQQYKRKTFKQMHLPEAASVLELGCGTGEDAIALAKLVGSSGKVVAVDYSQAMLDQAISSAKKLELPIEFVQADAQKLPDSFPSGWIGRNLYRYLQQMGLTQIQVNPETIFFTQLNLADQVLDLTQTAHRPAEKGIISQTVTEQWLHELQELDQARMFFSSFTALIVSGKK